MLFVFVFACATAVVGVTLVVRGALGVTAPLATIADDLRRPRTRETASLSVTDRLLDRLSGVPNAARSADLAVCDRTEDWFVQQRFVWALLASLPGLGLFAISTWGVEMFFPAPLLLAASAAGLVVGWFYARVDLRSDADRARREFRHSLAAYLELVTILMSGGAGVETSMFDAAALGRGSAFRHLRSALSAAHARRDPPWFGLGQLGSRIGVSELEELEASMTLAGGGAQVRDSLAAKASAMRMRDLADIESEAQARSETMVLPVALMFAGFVVLIGYPALAALSGP